MRLQLRLQRLDAMREAGARLIGRDRLGRDVFARGAPEGLRLVRKAALAGAICSTVIAAYGVGPGAHPAGVPRRPRAPGDDARRGDRAGRADDRLSARMDRARKLPAADARMRHSAARRWPRASSPRSSWPGWAGSRSTRTRPSRRSGCGRPDGRARARGRSDPVRVGRAADVEEIALMSARARSRSRSAELAAHYEGRGIELVERGGRWHFQTAPDLAHLLRREREEAARLSRAAVETLAIIAYHEPVSRAEIEAIRGVQISKGTLDVLMEAGWVQPAGRREGPGGRLLYATTAGLPDPFRARLAPRPAGHRRSQGRGPARPARRSARGIARRAATGK